MRTIARDRHPILLPSRITKVRLRLISDTRDDFASNDLLRSRTLNSKADKDSSRRLAGHSMLRQQLLLPLRHNMRVDGLSD